MGVIIKQDIRNDDLLMKVIAEHESIDFIMVVDGKHVATFRRVK